LGRLIYTVTLLVLLQGCIVVSTVGGAVMDGAMFMFSSEKESLAVPMRAALVASQRTLNGMALTANIIEPKDDGYILAFTNGSLSGTVVLVHETSHLTTMGVHVNKGMGREQSVEKAIISGIRNASKNISTRDHFDFNRYQNIHAQTSTATNKVAWYIPGSKFKVFHTRKDGWLKVKLPSGKHGFLKGMIKSKRG